MNCFDDRSVFNSDNNFEGASVRKCSVSIPIRKELAIKAILIVSLRNEPII